MSNIRRLIGKKHRFISALLLIVSIVFISLVLKGSSSYHPVLALYVAIASVAYTVQIERTRRKREMQIPAQCGSGAGSIKLK